MAQDKNAPAAQADGQTASDTPSAASNAAGTSRRRFLTGSAAAVGAGAAAAVGFPSIAVAQTTTLRFQSTWPNQDIFHEFASDYVRIVNEMSGGRLRLNLLPAGAVVGALQLQDAVISGALDGGHGVCAYWYGKHKAYSLFGTPPPFGWDANQFLAWYWTGGGMELYTELLEMLELPLVGYLTGPMPTQALGWFKEPIASADDLRGLKYRTVGLAADLMREFGAAVTIMGGGDIVPAMDRGLLDGAEFNNPSSDRLLGFPDVSKTWMLRSYHQDCESFEIIFNKTKHDSLPEEFQAILQYAAKAASSEMYWKAMERYPKDLQAMREQQGVQTYITPDSVLQAQLEAWNTVIENESQDPFFKKVIDHQREYCERVVGWHLEGTAPKEPAYRHFFGKEPTDTSTIL
ncbi:TRAP transporter substrate-binding protein [Halomonas sp. MCCC 1A17488]|uniref:TRAP transporter substrate-binding protein n=1 Tax=Billgrantia sulfidoxydans TaxID=2733484 RepID=A0ABX7W909_9GAMM|nr:MULTISPECIES: TRAP transporter substrate-binding protein [Halomonas]MCE8018010.1 TRAP transporter substrate-binding protein [Halomonas sp. MCCC 1A17488]MCG3241343.1 TRAP transporter substrate-binding protein [Halomonas sp. MCCC 1A17488]QPP48692.1 TRAP transporter substrate-binding protein [Halomonas sp. SS10-MC5]QTP56032.1 TRAP transporter substrate-binding protein [Halomonas sulfidoxydans]